MGKNLFASILIQIKTEFTETERERNELKLLLKNKKDVPKNKTMTRGQGKKFGPLFSAMPRAWTHVPRISRQVFLTDTSFYLRFRFWKQKEIFMGRSTR